MLAFGVTKIGIFVQPEPCLGRHQDWVNSRSSKPFNTDKGKLTNIQCDVDCDSIQLQKVTLVPLGRLENDNTYNLHRLMVKIR